MTSEEALKTKILGRLDLSREVEDEELQELQDYANNVSIKRLGYNDHGPVHMRQVVGNAIKMLNLLQDAGIPKKEIEDLGRSFSMRFASWICCRS